MSTPENYKKPTIVERMRNNLQPSGTAPVVQLIIAKYGMFDVNFVHQCIDELERMPFRVAVGDKPTKLEQLAYQILLDSAFIDLEYEAEREASLKKYAEEMEKENDGI